MATSQNSTVGGRFVDTRGVAATSASTRDAAALIGRVLVAAIFVVSGFGKIAGFAGTAGYIASKGLPFASLLTGAAILIELGAGLALVAGWKTRWAALAIAVFTIVITPIFHGFWNAAPDQVMNQTIHFQKNVSILGALILLFAFGPGRYSIDKG